MVSPADHLQQTLLPAAHANQLSCIQFELEFLTISYMPTCMTVTLFHHGLLNLWHVGQGQGGNACRAAGTGNIFFRGLQ